MRILFLILAVLTTTAAAQTPAIRQEFEAATKLARAQQFERAIEKYQSAKFRAENERASDEFLARVHFNIGVCYFQTKNLPEAVAEFNEAVKQSRGTYQKAFYALGMAQKDLKNWRQAETALRKAVELKPADGEAWFDLAFVSLNRQNFDAAETAFANAVRFKSVASVDAFNNLGVIFALKHDFQTAEIHFEKAIFESNGKSAVAKNNLQFCRQIRGKFDEQLLAKLEFSRK